MGGGSLLEQSNNLTGYKRAIKEAQFYPSFTVIQLNRHKEHPGWCLLAMEEENASISCGEL